MTRLEKFDKIAPLIAVPLLILSVAMQMKFGLMGDKGWLVLATNKWLSGEKLYVNIFEVNPPLILWIYTAPVWVSRHVSFITDYAALGLIGVAVTAVAIWFCRRLIARHPFFAENPGRRLESTLLLAFVLLFIQNPVYFFDREHIMLMLALPYMLRFMPSLARTRYPLPLRLGIGVLAAIGFCVKLHAMLVFAALQVLYMVRERSPFVLGSVENIVIYLLMAAYFALIATYTPEYFTTMLPMAWAVYSSYNVNESRGFYLHVALLSAIIPLIEFRPRYETPLRRDIYYFILVTLIYLGYALINNGWGYTYQPLFCMLTYTTGWLLWEYDWIRQQYRGKSLPVKQFDIGLKGCIYCLAFNGVFGVFMIQAHLSAPDYGHYPEDIGDKPFVDAIREKKFRSFGVMSGEFTRWPLISRMSGARWDTRFNHLWMVPGLVKARENKAAPDDWNKDQWIVSFVGKAFAEDFALRKPDAVFVDNSDEFFTYPGHIDILALLEAVPEFKKAWKHDYRYDSTINHCKSKDHDSQDTVGCRYDIYRRKNPSK